MNKHGVSRRWITETDVKYFKGAAITIIARKKEYTFYGKLEKKKKFLQRCISKIFLFIDTERHSKM